MGYLTLALAGHCLPGHGRTVTTRTETPEIGSHFLQPLFRCSMLVFHLLTIYVMIHNYGANYPKNNPFSSLMTNSI